MQQNKPWKCKNGHTLGLVQRSNKQIRQLVLYREAIDPLAEDASDVDVIAVVEGYTSDVRCSICGALRMWVPGEEALTEMLRRTLGQPVDNGATRLPR